MGLSRSASALLTVVSLSGCTTAYQARIGLAPDDPASARATIDHCLASLGFSDRSGDPIQRQLIAEEPGLESVWEPPRGTMWSSPPFSTASVRHQADHWSVAFVPAPGGGDDAHFFVEALSKCITLHAGTVPIEVTSERFIDLR